MSTDFRFSPRPNRAAEIAWRDWDASAFDAARSADRPILLSISAVWCHWCHVMDETTYSDERVIALVNERFVPVRVDNDRRPDVNARYNMGGWPTTAFLAPDGETLTGATYVPPDSFVRMLEQVDGYYHENREQIAEKIAALRAQRAQPAVPQSGVLSEQMVDDVVAALAANYDEEYGGFGTEPKFPQTDALELLLLEYRFALAHGRDAAGLLHMLSQTALAMARGGMYDHIEGGFFRYSTTRDWTVPHFEKMAEDHAGLLRVYAGLYETTHTPALRETLVSASQWVRTVLRDPATGLFGGSQDADEVYFALPLEERRRRQAPFVDRTSYTNWTCGLASALLAVARALEDDTMAAEAVATLDTVEARLSAPSGLLYHVLPPGGAPAVPGLLTDAAAYLRACVDAHEATGEARFVRRAVGIAESMERILGDGGGAYLDRPPDAEALGLVAIPDRPLVENGLVAEALLRLAYIADRPAYRERAHRILASLAPHFRRAGAFAAAPARAVRRYLSPATTVTLAAADAPAVEDLRETALRLSDPLTVVRTVKDGAGLRQGHGSVCIGTTCAAPVDEPRELVKAYDKLWDTVAR